MPFLFFLDIIYILPCMIDALEVCCISYNHNINSLRATPCLTHFCTLFEA